MWPCCFIAAAPSEPPPVWARASRRHLADDEALHAGDLRRQCLLPLLELREALLCCFAQALLLLQLLVFLGQLLRDRQELLLGRALGLQDLQHLALEGVLEIEEALLGRLPQELLLLQVLVLRAEVLGRLLQLLLRLRLGLQQLAHLALQLPLALPERTGLHGRLAQDFFPDDLHRPAVELRDEGVALGLCGRQPLLRTKLAQALDEVLCLGIHPAREAEVAAEDQPARRLLAGGAEGRLPDSHLVQQHAHLPHVQALGVALAPDHLRGQVVGSAAERRAVRCSLPQVVGPPKVRELHVALPVKQDVLRLDVAVDHLLRAGVEVLERIAGLVEILRGDLVAELAAFAEEVKHASTLGKLHAHVDMGLVAEVKVHLDDEGVLERPEDADLALRLVHEVVLLDDRQGDLLDGQGLRIDLFVTGGGSPLALPDLAEVALAQAPHEDEAATCDGHETCAAAGAIAVKRVSGQMPEARVS
eukprot:CAMPEP_0175576520 /NCGR_PEP_ID=MMETSP0096-20121207/45116_1 /TAXON_ID=311494 /ORGANISM="Alexandrium monilatum, Strain CCMP3105" /LENGTH=474 /DNA_ID=CAMNT_0016880069 /DNA_START=45 /DNA_END=1470 /DNA_ORIENTATION=-